MAEVRLALSGFKPVSLGRNGSSSFSLCFFYNFAFVSIRIILYAIALVDNDQEQTSDAATLISAKDGLQTLALYLASASR